MSRQATILTEHDSFPLPQDLKKTSGDTPVFNQSLSNSKLIYKTYRPTKTCYTFDLISVNNDLGMNLLGLRNTISLSIRLQFSDSNILSVWELHRCLSLHPAGGHGV